MLERLLLQPMRSNGGRRVQYHQHWSGE
jgi:hypothetical protein